MLVLLLGNHLPTDPPFVICHLSMDAVIDVNNRSESEEDEGETTELFVIEELEGEAKEDVPLGEKVDLIVGHPEAISVGEQMQILCDLYGFKQDTFWDSYRDDQRDALRNKLSLIVSNEFVTEKNLVKINCPSWVGPFLPH